MSGRAPSFIILYDGQLSLDEKFVPTYTSGKTRPLQVPPRSNIQQLKTRVLRALKCDTLRFNVKIVGRFPVGNEFIASPVKDDEACEVLLSLAIGDVMILYVEVEQIPVLNNHEEICSTPIPDYITPTLGGETPPGVRSREPMQERRSRYAERDYVDDLNQVGHNESNVEEGYETMSSGSSEDGSEDLADLDGVPITETFHKHNEIEEIIRDYCTRTTEGDVNMFASNEYRETCKTTHEWNAEITGDNVDLLNLSSEEFVIPNELVEGMCYRRKCDLQFAVQGWSIKNNVEYVVIASNKKILTICCLQHDNRSAPCPWRLHARLSKRLGGVWKTIVNC